MLLGQSTTLFDMDETTPSTNSGLLREIQELKLMYAYHVTLHFKGHCNTITKIRLNYFCIALTWNGGGLNVVNMGFDADKWLPGHLLTDINRLNTNFVSSVHNVRWWEEYVFMGHPLLIKFKFSTTSCRAVQIYCCT